MLYGSTLVCGPGKCIWPVRVQHKIHLRHLLDQGVRIMLHLILHLIMIERDHLIEVDLLAAGKSADFAALPDNILRAHQNCGAELRVLCKG